MRTALLLVLLLAACDDRTEVIAPERSGPPVVRASIPPIASLARHIGGDAVVVEVALPNGSDPVFWRPDAGGVIAFQEADLVLLNGARLEKWADNVSLPDNRVVRTANGFRKEWITFEEEVRHRHGPKGEHSHVGVNPYTWVDPLLAVEQADAILAGMVRLMPGEAGLTARHADLRQELERIDAELKKLPKARLQSDEPGLAYLARRYGWTVAKDGTPVDLALGLERGADLLDALRTNLERLKAAAAR